MTRSSLPRGISIIKLGCVDAAKGGLNLRLAVRAGTSC